MDRIVMNNDVHNSVFTSHSSNFVPVVAVSFVLILTLGVTVLLCCGRKKKQIEQQDSKKTQDAEETFFESAYSSSDPDDLLATEDQYLPRQSFRSSRGFDNTSVQLQAKQGSKNVAKGPVSGSALLSLQKMPSLKLTTVRVEAKDHKQIHGPYAPISGSQQAGTTPPKEIKNTKTSPSAKMDPSKIPVPQVKKETVVQKVSVEKSAQTPSKFSLSLPAMTS